MYCLSKVTRTCVISSLLYDVLLFFQKLTSLFLSSSLVSSLQYPGPKIKLPILNTGSSPLQFEVLYYTSIVNPWLLSKRLEKSIGVMNNPLLVLVYCADTLNPVLLSLITYPSLELKSGSRLEGIKILLFCNVIWLKLFFKLPSSIYWRSPLALLSGYTILKLKKLFTCIVSFRLLCLKLFNI